MRDYERVIVDEKRVFRLRAQPAILKAGKLLDSDLHTYTFAVHCRGVVASGCWPKRLTAEPNLTIASIAALIYDPEAIRIHLELSQLKARHLRLGDTKSWDEYAALMSEDFVLDISGSADVAVIHGRDKAVAQVRKSVEGAVTVHQAHTPEFDFNADEVAIIWAMHTRVFRGPEQPSYTLYGYHHDRWVRAHGVWTLAGLRQTTLHLDVHAPTRA